MTFEEQVRELLGKCKIPEVQINEVVGIVKGTKMNASMLDRWDHDTKNYPAVLERLMWLSARAIAIQFCEPDEEMLELLLADVYDECGVLMTRGD